MSTSSKASIVTIDSFLQSVGTAEKRAAEANTEPGSIGGATTHPVKDVDDRTEDAKEGARSAENDSDVKEDQGKIGVNSVPEASAKSAFDLGRFAKPMGKLQKRAEEASGGAVQTPGSASDDQLQIGTKKEPTGEDPANETGSAKAGKEDSGSTHPARTDNTALDGHKYAFDAASYMRMTPEVLAEKLEKVGNDLVSSIITELGTNPATPQHQKQASAQAGQPNVAHQAGWELAGLASGQLDKQAADAMVTGRLQEIIKTASADADNVVAYLTNYEESLRKMAADPSMMDPAMMGGDPAAGGGDPMAAMGGGGAPPEGGPGADQAMLASLGGGGGGDPMAGGGGDPMAGGGGGEGVDELLQTLDQLGISPQDLNQALLADAGGEGGGGEAGGPPPGAGGPPPGGDAGGGAPPEGGEPPPEADPTKQARDRHVKQAAVKKGNSQMSAREYIQELVARSKR